MDVILLERVENLGQMGEVVKVKPGFARNFLLPKKKALRATKQNLSVFEGRRAQLEAENLSRREDAQKVGAKLDGLKIVIVRQAAESGQLYGSVTLRDIADEVTKAGFTIQKSQVLLNAPIKETGVHEVRISLHPEVKVSVSVAIARSAEEATAQAAAADRASAAQAAAAEEAPVAEG